MTSPLELADLLRTYGPAYKKQHKDAIPYPHQKAMYAIEACRTPLLGGQVYACDTCAWKHKVFHSCRNRHCPKCQALPTKRWIDARQQDLLPIPYFHVVFTLPEQLKPIARKNQTLVYNLLFKAASQTLKDLGADQKHLGARIGFIAVLHTWTQTLLYHPHLHCIVTGGGLSKDGGNWVPAKDDFFIHVHVLSSLFRGKFLAFLEQAFQDDQLTLPESDTPAHTDFKRLKAHLHRLKWNVHCKAPLGGPKQVLAYLGRYTHRIAISNDRILGVKDDHVFFRYRDRKNGDQLKTMPLPVFEFFRRFLTHVLPKGFVKIRHFGILANRHRKPVLAHCRKLLCHRQTPPTKQTGPTPWQELVIQLTGKDPLQCPHCKKGRLRFNGVLLPAPQRAPPAKTLLQA